LGYAGKAKDYSGMQRGGKFAPATGAYPGAGSRGLAPESAVAHDPHPLPTAPARRPSGDAGHGGTRVLVVDDHADAAHMLADLLRVMDYEACTALDGRQALQALEAFAPHVALLDIGLPDMDGYELAQRVRSGPRGPSIRLVALTGFGQEQDRALALSCGFDDFLVKPVDIHQLVQVIDRLRA
jgi:CheY-like chemotaxis protein